MPEVFVIYRVCYNERGGHWVEIHSAYRTREEAAAVRNVLAPTTTWYIAPAPMKAEVLHPARDLEDDLA